MKTAIGAVVNSHFQEIDFYGLPLRAIENASKTAYNIEMVYGQDIHAHRNRKCSRGLLIVMGGIL